MNSQSKNKLIFFILFIFFSILFVLYFYTQAENRIKDFKNYSIENRLNVYTTLIKTFEEKARIIFYEIMEDGKIVAIYKQLESANNKKKHLLRKELHNLLKNKFIHYKKSFNIAQMHFHLANSESFLRLHRPSKFGDSLIDIRETVEKANEEKVFISGYEIGRNHGAYRFIFPIKDNQAKHLGTVEIPFNAASLVDSFIKSFNTIGNFHFSNEIIEKKIWKEPLEKRYMILPFTQMYGEKALYKKAIEFINSNNETLPKAGNRSAKNFIIKLRKNKEKKAISYYQGDNQLLVIFLPIINPINNDLIGYFSSRADAKSIAEFKKIFYIQSFTTVFLFGLFFFLIYRKINSNFEEQKILEEKVNKQIQKLRQNDIIILEQSKLASMGEMIGNIAHQWRQPLNAISTAASGMELKYEMNALTKEDMKLFSEGIIKNTKFLSATIDTFRDFIKTNKEKEEVEIQKEILQAINIIEAVLKSKFISLRDNIDYNDPIILKTKAGELPQALINIFNNAKDVILERKVKDGWVELNLKYDESIILVTIEDNAGGIPKKIISKVFEPYFTTKHKSQGTGLGLHIAYKIITESLQGNVYVKNTKNGAKFFIEIPIKKN